MLSETLRLSNLAGFSPFKNRAPETQNKSFPPPTPSLPFFPCDAKLLSPSAQIRTMQSLRSLFHHKKQLLHLAGSRTLLNPHTLASNPQEGLRLSLRPVFPRRRSFSAGNRSWEEDSRAWPGSGDPGESPLSFASYDPFTDRLESRPDGVLDPGLGKCSTEEEEEEREEGVTSWAKDKSRIGKAVQKRTVPSAKKSGDEVPSDGGEKSGVSCVSSSNSRSWSSMARRRAGKEKSAWVCEFCGANHGQWWGTCPSCQVGVVKKFSVLPEISKARGAEVSEAAVRSWLPQKAGKVVPKSLSEVNKGRDQSEWRIPLAGLFGMEVARVLGGGIVPGSLVLVGGDPGVGKSTLLLQIAAIIAEGMNLKGPSPVVYVSGEESIEQIGHRADRMRITTKDLYLYSSTDVEDILDKIQELSPGALIVDSIQTVYLRGVAGSAGSIMQVKECTSALLRFAKQTNIPVFLIGHVTKTGDIAGPRILEHIVDAVLYMEGERYSSYRLLRSVKNRFGSTDELGVLEMSESGLQAVSNPSEMFMTEHDSDSEVLAGLAVSVIVDGSRTFVIEIQALCASQSSVSRYVNGVKESRADMIISVLMKQAGLKLQDYAIFLNVVSGIKLTETAGDLAIAAAICSSFLEFPIPNDVAFIGEIGLGGELRTVPRMDKRVIAVAKLGYKKCVVPKPAEKVLAALDQEIVLLACRNLKEVINVIFQGES